MIDPLSLAIACTHIEDWDVVSVRHEVIVRQIDELRVQFEVVSKLAVRNGPPWVKLDRHRIVVFYSTAPFVGHFADIEAYAFFITLLWIQVEILEVEELVVVVDIYADTPLRCHIKSVCEHKVRVDFDAPILSQNKCYMVTIRIGKVVRVLVAWEFVLLHENRGILYQFWFAEVAHTLLQTKLDEPDIFTLAIQSWTEKPELKGRFVFKEHGVFSITDVNEVDEFERLVKFDNLHIGTSLIQAYLNDKFTFFFELIEVFLDTHLDDELLVC